MQERPADQVAIVGRFPPPLDGQAIATRRLARLLEQRCDLKRIDMSVGETDLAESDVRLRSGRLSHYMGARSRIRNSLLSVPDATVLWTGISASTLGHYRDILVTYPSLGKRTRVFAVVHWGNFHRLFERASTVLTAKYLVRKLSGFVFLNQLLHDRCARWIPADKRWIIPNTIEESIWLTEDELDAKRLARQKRERFRMLYLGSMTGTKGWADTVRAAELLHRGGASFQLDLVGRWESTEDKANYSHYVQRNGLSEVVKHHGAISDRTIIKELLAQADAFVLPTYYPTEAQPLTVIEALNAGTPIITTRHSGLPDMIEEGVEGYFVPPRDPEAIAGAVERLRPFDHWRTISIAARNRFERQFHPEKVLLQWTDLVLGK